MLEHPQNLKMKKMPPLQLIKDKLKTAGHVVVLTGAGMSQESGLPTYRATEDGLWNQHVISEVATAEALRRDPKKVWQWLQSLTQNVAGAAPNAGHAALAQLQQHCKVTVVTQNVDDLHERAGSTEVIHLHGNAFAYRCTDCDRSMTVPTPLPSDWEMLRQQVRCTYCDGHIRHDVVLFNEMLDHTRIDRAHQAIRDCHVVLMVGTSNLVYPAAGLPIYAIELNKFVAEINPQDTPMSSMVSARLNSLAASALPELMDWLAN
jgi:NAD-dependent deacetylase